MSNIPRKAFRIGAEALNQFPIRYGKSKISGSQTTSYILHSKGGNMPGQSDVFIDNSLTRPNCGASLVDNRINNAFKIEKFINSRYPIGIKYSHTALNNFTYDEYHPSDDTSLSLSINAAYKQVYGNLHAFESERPIDIERRLRNGDITIREFIRNLAKSLFYRYHYFENVTQQRCIELNIKHILGRSPFDQSEIVKNIEFLHQEGFDKHIDFLIDSTEYMELFGDHIVPFIRCWDSSCGLRTSSFMYMAKLAKSFATSDNAIHSSGPIMSPKTGNSQLLKEMI